MLSRDEFDYVPFYCEENIWRLLGRGTLTGTRAWALLVSNAERRVLFMRQRSGRPVDGLIQWDYHALALVDDPLEGYQVFDLDSELGFPCPLQHYVQSTFPDDLSAPVLPLFRALPARDYVAGLVSDRSHMRRADGSWKAPPPPWDHPGAGKQLRNNLMEWTDMGRKRPGRVLSLAALRSLALSGRANDRRLPR